MPKPPLGLVAVGNALVDVLTQTTDAFIADQKAKHGMEKGAMSLIDQTIRRYGQGRRNLGRIGGQHDGGLRLVRRQGWFHR